MSNLFLLPYQRLLGLTSKSALGVLCDESERSISFAGAYEDRAWRALSHNLHAERVHGVVHGRALIRNSLIDGREAPYYVVHDSKTGITILAQYAALGRQLRCRVEVYRRALLSMHKLDGFGYVISALIARFIISGTALFEEPMRAASVILLVAALAAGLAFPRLASLAVILFPWPWLGLDPGVAAWGLPSPPEGNAISDLICHLSSAAAERTKSPWGGLAAYAGLSLAGAIIVYMLSGIAWGVAGLLLAREWRAFLREEPHPNDGDRASALLRLFGEVRRKSEADAGISEGDILRGLQEEARSMQADGDLPSPRALPALSPLSFFTFTPLNPRQLP